MHFMTVNKKLPILAWSSVILLLVSFLVPWVWLSVALIFLAGGCGGRVAWEIIKPEKST